MEKAVTITEIEFVRRLSFELIMKMLEGLPGIYSAELFEWFIYSQFFRLGSQKQEMLLTCISAFFVSLLSGHLKAADKSGALFFYTVLYSQTIDLTLTGSLKEGVMSHPLKKDLSDTVGNRRKLLFKLVHLYEDSTVYFHFSFSWLLVVQCYCIK